MVLAPTAEEEREAATSSVLRQTLMARHALLERRWSFVVGRWSLVVVVVGRWSLVVGRWCIVGRWSLVVRQWVNERSYDFQ